MIPETETRPNPRRWDRRPWLISVATAATIVLAIACYDRFVRRGVPEVMAIGWGWNRPEALPQDLPPAAYLNHLADGANDWFAKRPRKPEALARRLTEFRVGCSTLIAADHEPLALEDRAWLVDQCRAWATTLEDHVTALEAGRDSQVVQGEADQTIKALIKALRERARRLSVHAPVSFRLT